MGLFDIKSAITKWLGVTPLESPMQLLVREGTTKEVVTLKNQLWYRGDPVELEQFYQQVASYSLDSLILSTRFWAATPSNDDLIRKFHSGLPRLIADKLAQIVVDDMSDAELDGGELQRWEDVAEDNNFDELVKDAVVRALTEGDGAFKICVDPELSGKPLIEFYSGNNVDFVYKRGRLLEIQFYTDYYKGDKRFKLAEHYGKGYVHYHLFDDNGKEVGLETLEETAELLDITFAGEYIMGVPMMFYKSPKFKGRGESIFEGKGDTFDALDEVLSTWLDAVRAGRVKQYIPEMLVPRNEETGVLRKPNVFNGFIVKNTDLSEDADNKIEVVQGDLNYDGLLQSYMTFLDASLQGLISPSTIGIDVKKLDNAESQREKEKTTMYTRDTIIGVLSKVLPKVVEVVLKTEDNMNGKSPKEEYKSTFEWGQYANPSFEAMVETIGKAKTHGIMSVERCIEELYGDTLSKEEKAEEVARLKSEVELDQPAVNDDVLGGFGEENGQQL